VPESYRTTSEEETIALGVKLGGRLAAGTLVLLIGNLGAGKTTLAKGIARGLGAAEEDEVSSPTFTLIHEYGDPPQAYHVDLYRLDEERQVVSLGLEEILESDAVTMIEWGERFPGLWPAEHVEVELRRIGDEDREIEIRGL
jgi:tRNA threonylcarbamoyladenosine biosynthesis protein TsaE